MSLAPPRLNHLQGSGIPAHPGTPYSQSHLRHHGGDARAHDQRARDALCWPRLDVHPGVTSSVYWRLQVGEETYQLCHKPRNA